MTWAYFFAGLLFGALLTAFLAMRLFDRFIEPLLEQVELDALEKVEAARAEQWVSCQKNLADEIEYIENRRDSIRSGARRTQKDARRSLRKAKLVKGRDW